MGPPLKSRPLLTVIQGATADANAASARTGPSGLRATGCFGENRYGLSRFALKSQPAPAPALAQLRDARRREVKPGRRLFGGVPLGQKLGQRPVAIAQGL